MDRAEMARRGMYADGSQSTVKMKKRRNQLSNNDILCTNGERRRKEWRFLTDPLF
jgi:hypothetical protein